jgi:predicted TIM-barrel fold metal-dependent hydrolase
MSAFDSNHDKGEPALDDSLPLQARLRHPAGCADCEPASPARRGFLLGALGSAALAGCSGLQEFQGVTLPPAPSSYATGTTAANTGAPAAAPVVQAANYGRIDVHHHHSPPAWLAVARSRGIDGLAANWSVQKSLADMDAAGIQTSMLSVTTPGVVFRDLDQATGRKLARDSNEYGAKLKADHKGRFGFFAALPMNDTEGALQEIAYSIDTLKADGIGLLTSYGDKWLGDASFFPIMEEINRRKLLVYTHPTAANCCQNLVKGVPPVMIEFGTDTTRAIASILFDGGNAQRFRDIKWIFSHAGGTMPFLIERFVRHPTLVPAMRPNFPNGVLPELQRFWYDTAQVSNTSAMSALTKIMPVEQIVFGSDFPYRTNADHVKNLRDIKMFTPAQLRMIERDTALKLLPQWRT